VEKEKVRVKLLHLGNRLRTLDCLHYSLKFFPPKSIERDNMDREKKKVEAYVVEVIESRQATAFLLVVHCGRVEVVTAVVWVEVDDHEEQQVVEFDEMQLCRIGKVEAVTLVIEHR
jgi:hypothetical protein